MAKAKDHPHIGWSADHFKVKHRLLGLWHLAQVCRTKASTRWRRWPSDEVYPTSAKSRRKNGVGKGSGLGHDAGGLLTSRVLAALGPYPTFIELCSTRLYYFVCIILRPLGVCCTWCTAVFDAIELYSVILYSDTCIVITLFCDPLKLYIFEGSNLSLFPITSYLYYTLLSSIHCFVPISMSYVD